ncbi:HTH domain-containing protein [Maribacter sp. 2307UL18-2]|uniref:HTH domain-containing protein n=1 Tax=Maribacter sp. 2307UL18-2 TaxID=3386274 RepID=UPI0039BC6F30
MARQPVKKHRVSVRTIYREICTLEKSGLPIITEEGKGYSIVEGYHFPLLFLPKIRPMSSSLWNNKQSSLMFLGFDLGRLISLNVNGEPRKQHPRHLV